MQFSDLNSHLSHISRLLNEGRAVAVVGAGFSRNASQKLTTISDSRSPAKLPDWNGLISSIAKELYPTDEAKQKHCLNSGPLHVAELFVANRNRSELDNLIKKSLTEVKFEPGNLHQRLIKLPWSDILTFNYDSLLEESCQEFASNKYTTVYSADNLVNARRPRIIKLHGSLPNGPFILTEEDFRSYAQKNAIFVNTARQLMIENALVLFGFSGNDPNFKQIHGWVRDLLDRNLNPVYLCHVNGFTEFEERLFSNTYHLEPLNLAKLLPPGAHMEHADCLTAFFDKLQIKDPESKPKAPPVHMARWLDGVSINYTDPSYIKFSSPSKLPAVELIYEEWVKQRTDYPGWLIAPLEMRKKVSENTNFWPSYLQAKLKTIPLEQAVFLVWELLWRWDVSLEVIPVDWARWVDELIPQAEGLPQVAEKLLDLQMFSLRNLREEMNEEEFYKLLEKFKEPRCNNADLHANILHEECLFALQALDFDSLDNAINELKYVNNINILNCVRRIGWLLEMDMMEEARVFVANLTKEVENKIKSEESSIELLSVEGWILFIDQLIYHTNIENLSVVLHEHKARWHQLRAVECDPWERINELQRSLNAPPSLQKTETTYNNFDPGVTTRTILLSEGFRECDSLAFQYLRLFDFLGIPHFSGNLRIASEAMGKACKLIMPMAFKWSMATRIRNEDKTLLMDMGRGFVLRLSENSSSWLIKASLRGLRQLLPRLPDDDQSIYRSHSGRYVSFLLQVASRMTIRMKEDQLDELFGLLCSYRENSGFKKAFVKWKDWGEALRRVLFSGSRQQLTSWLSVLARMPFAPPTPYDNTTLPFSFEPFMAVKSANILELGIKLKISDDVIEEWVNGLQSDVISIRAVAFERLLYYLNTNKLTVLDIPGFDNSLWNYCDKDGLPVGTNYLPSTFLNLASKRSEQLKVVLKDRMVSNDFPSMQDNVDNVSEWSSHNDVINYLSNFLNSVGRPWKTKGKNSCVEFNYNESKVILDKYFTWWSECRHILADQKNNSNSVIKSHNILEMFEKSLAYSVIHVLKGSDLQKVKIVVSSMRDMGYEPYHLMVAFLMANELAAAEIISSITNDILSLDEYRVIAAIQALGLWATWAKRKNIKKMPPKSLMDLVFSHIQHRIKSGLSEALSLASTAVSAGWWKLSNESLSAINNGLMYLQRETKIEPSSNDVFEVKNNEDAQLCKLRENSALLAFNLSNYYLNNNETPPDIIENWLKDASMDQLPEVRRILQGA